MPRGASGGRYAAVVFELIPEERKGEAAFASSTFVQRFATVVELTVPARQMQRRLDVTGFSVDYAVETPAYASVYGKDAVISVSYTHLDVYKRQTEYRLQSMRVRG